MEEIRRKIDAVDREIAELFEKRLEFSRKIGKYKKENNIPTEDPVREAEIIEKLTNGKSEEDASALRSLYERIFEISKENQ